MNNRDQRSGVFYAALSYLIWGILPIYWKLLEHVNPGETLALRICWSFIFMIILLLVTKKLFSFFEFVRGMFKHKRQTFALIIASILITINWFLYIWAVNHDRIIETSLGYYINPLISVLLGMFVLKEKLSIAQYVSFAMAAVGVLILSISFGQFPWISIGLALSFALYGLAKKLLQVDSEIGLTLETLVITPVAVIYLVLQKDHSFLNGSLSTDLLLIGSGVATAVPLLLFAKGAQKIPLTLMGFLQYIAPTISLLIGVFMYKESFTPIHFVSFSFIWLALTIYSISKIKIFNSIEAKRKNAS